MALGAPLAYRASGQQGLKWLSAEVAGSGYQLKSGLQFSHLRLPLLESPLLGPSCLVLC